MSTDDFQNKFASFMESVVKSTVVETTKLFETLVEELKAELSEVKTENEALKTTCRQIQDAKTLAISESVQSGRLKMHDTAVQCDLPRCPMLEVQSMELQNKQSDEEYSACTSLKDHDYESTKDVHSKPTVLRDESTHVQYVSEGTSTDGSRKSPTKSIVAHLRCDLKMGSQAERTKTTPETFNKQNMTEPKFEKGTATEPETAIEQIPISSEKPFVAEDCASKIFESPLHPRSKSTTGVTDMTETKLSPLSDCTANPCLNNAASQKLGDCHQTLGSGSTQEKQTQTSPPATITKKPSAIKLEDSPNKSKSTTLCLRSSTTKDTTATQKTKFPPESATTSDTKGSTAKKSRLNQTATVPDHDVKFQNAKKLAKAAKSKTVDKSKQTKLKKLNQAVNDYTTDETATKCPSQLMWTRAREAALLRETRSSLFQRRTSIPRSPDHSAVSPQSLSHQLTHVKASPIVSPPQLLTVPGEQLLKNQCGECGRVLSSSAALESHVSLHTGHRPFSCTLCGKSFPDSKGLKRHGRVHGNGRIHICQECGKGFVYGFGLTKHVQMVHGKIKPFVCQLCNKAFFTKRDVETHIRIHTGEKPFHCHLCEKKFVRRVELNVHLRWHNGEKRHWCPYCGKGFLDYNNLKRHKYIHTGEKPHSCPHCPKHFTQSGHLKKHVKNVHKVK
ncbi:zinc finger protein 43 [Hippocampus zosterae]|uniref:zinc finger protein 43 n=1 Tax=Hippocampus zosterae TaxID=109293 RepID=UPI00223E03B4|nr:zinc finger protein 43 [Hippocampus zosterae]